MVVKNSEILDRSRFLTSIIISLVLGCGGLIFNQIVTSKTNSQEITHLKETISDMKSDISRLYSDKADKAMQAELKSQIVSMNTKLDKIIEKL